MRLSSLFPSKYLRAADLDGDTPVTLKSLVIEEVNGEDKPVLHWLEPVKKMVLNVTNSKIIGSLHGNETDDWPDKKIILYPTEVNFRGEIVDAIRVHKRIPAQQGVESASEQTEKDDLAF